jgi:hypothetical protein
VSICKLQTLHDMFDWIVSLHLKITITQ